MFRYRGGVISAIGIDFGTTNSAAGWVDQAGQVQLATFPAGNAVHNIFRSVLYFEPGYTRTPRPYSGWAAIEAYLGRQEGGRLIQSVKSLASDRLFRHTRVMEHLLSFEDLVAAILRGLTPEIDRRARVVAGRPVRFVGAANEADDEFAVNRLRGAYRQAGFENVVFEYEPVGAAWHYESQLDHDELVLIADFGGGTSDFSLLNVGPGVRRRGRTEKDLIGSEGVGVAGDSFDAAMVRHVVSPQLGSGTHYRSLDKRLPVPHSIYRKLERWHHLSFLRSKETMQILRSLEAQGERPDLLALLIELVERDLGFQLHQAVQRTKAELSRACESQFRFSEPGLKIEQQVTRMQFERWIEPELAQIRGGVERLLATTGVESRQVDRVFLTGGTSLVPAVRRVFEERFGEAKIRVGDQFTSVAMGLALRANSINFCY